jgi:alanine racemase
MDRLPNRVVIDLPALRHNLAQIRSLIPSGTGITAVVKADAYGHGMVDAARTLEAAGAERLAVAHLAEGVRLRGSGVRCPIVVLCGILTREEAEAVVLHDLIPVLPEPAAARVLSEESRRRGRRARVQLKIDTGMGRLGVPRERTAAFVEEVLKQEGLMPEGLLSHLSSADEPDRRYTEAQIRTFRTALDAAREQGMGVEASSLANSAGTLRYPESHLGMVRPGILLYGGSPSPELHPSIPLEPAMHLKATVLQVRDFPEGAAVSYGRTYETAGPERIAVLSAGYSDGLPRSLSNRGQVLLGGERAPIRGRICMNLTMVDVSRLPDVRPGDEAVFLGRQGEAVLTGDDVAAACGTISYEIYCTVGRCGEKTAIP